MKKLLSLLLTVCLLAGALSLTVSAAEKQVTINVYNWGQYIADGTDGSIDVIAEFEKCRSVYR